jgi:geranylgeranyl diphosphate synthase type I
MSEPGAPPSSASAAPLQRYSRYVELVEAEMQAVLREAEARATGPAQALPSFYGIMRYHLGWAGADLQPARAPQGKRLRPTLCLLACEALGGRLAQAVPAAAALELLHNFTLVHDDVQDRDVERHHRPAVWTLWGLAQAINVGDGLHVLSSLAMVRLQEQGISAGRVLEMLALLHRTCLVICEGQYLDILFEQRWDVSLDEYLDMIRRKSAALLSCAAELGACVAGAAAESRSALARFGLELGMAFQVQDDLLGVWGDEALTGKRTANDLRTRKKAFPLVYALEHGTPEQRRELLDLLARPGDLSDTAVRRAIELLEAAGALVQARAAVARYSAAALECLAALPPSPAREELRTMAALLRERRF